ncbi:MAG: hypothetical protein ACNYWU_08910 [Desulfobacterales bacterium]
MTKKWETYEEVSVYLLDKIRDELNLSGIEGKQKLIGKDTGTEWEVDAKGISEGTIGIILVEECGTSYNPSVKHKECVFNKQINSIR